MVYRPVILLFSLLVLLISCRGGQEESSGTSDRDRVNQFRGALGTPALVLLVSDFGAKGDGLADDSAAIQAALDASATLRGPNVVWFERTTYRTSRTLLIKQHTTRIEGNHAIIDYHGDGYALDVKPIDDTVYPVKVSLNEINIILNKDGATGVHWRFSYSFARSVDVSLKAANQTGFELLGDVNGTGPYYNTLIDCSVQGTAPAFANQRGWVFTYDSTTPTRGPNTNVFIHGRTGQVDVAWSLHVGAKNQLLGVTCEGIVKTVFDIGHPTSPVGCVSNSVQDVYVEGAAGANVFQIGQNSVDTAILNPFVTSIGTGQTYIDGGVGTRIYAAEAHTLPTKGLVLAQPSAVHLPVVRGPYPGVRLSDSQNKTELNLRNSSSFSGGSSFFTADDGTKNLMSVGFVEAKLHAPTLLLNDSKLGIYSGIGEPAIDAVNGSLYLRRDGKAGSSLYVLEDGKWKQK